MKMNKKCGYKKGQTDSHTKCYNSFVNWGPLGVATCKIYVLSNYNNYIKKLLLHNYTALNYTSTCRLNVFIF